MQKANADFIIASATSGAYEEEAFALAVLESIEAGYLIPSVLRRELQDRGFTVVETPWKVLTQVQVFSGPNLVAMGAASDKHEAILAAALGWFREHPVPELEAPTGIGTVDEDGTFTPTLATKK